MVESIKEEKEAIRAVFKNFDKDNSGTLEVSEISLVAKELGHEVSADDLKKIFADIDTNKDNKISFDEFFVWWKFGRENKLERLVYLQLKAMNLLNKAKAAYNKIGGLLESKYNEEVSSNFFNVSVGSLDAKSAISVRAVAGTKHKEFFDEKTAGSGLSHETAGILFRFQSNNPEAAKTEILALLEQIKELAGSMIPSDEAQALISTISFKGFTNGSFVVVSIENDHPMISMLLDQYIGLASMFLSDSFAEVNIEAGGSRSFKDLISNQDKKFTDMVESGLHLSANISVSRNLVETIKQIVNGSQLEKVRTLIEQNNAYLAKRLVRSSFLFLLFKSSKVNIQFKDLTDLKEKAVGTPLQLALEKPETIGQSIENFKKQFNPAEMIGQIPMAAELIAFGQNNMIANVEIIVNSPAAAVSVGVKTEGIKEVFDILLQN